MESLNLIKNDPWLAPYEAAIEGRYQYVIDKEKSLTNNGKLTLSEMASGYLYFGLHKTTKGWVFREWAPNATAIYLIGTFNGWQKDNKYKLKRKANGVWEIALTDAQMCHEDLFKLLVEWDGGSGERIPAWTRRVVQDEQSKIFSAQVWNPEKPYKFKNKRFKPKKSPLLIYECHIGMSTNEEKVGTYNEFRQNILPRVAKDGYNAIQIMAIQEHPYYGSFGYHVSSFFAASSRFGTPDELKQLIDEAHGMGLAVIMDIVHSHAVKNEVEGLGRFDGSYDQYFLSGERREHPAWDSLCFNYGKNEVLHFLLSNCKFWLEEYKFDGFRFDGVTSMLYYSHGLGEAFCNYGDYFNGHQDGDAIAYLTLANKLIHEVNPEVITIAEDMSGMPGLAMPVGEGGLGFDFRMSMGVPDYWIKLIEDKKDEEWHVGDMFYELTNKRPEEHTISYAESHDQAMVGDKTIFFRLVDKDIYTSMSVFDHSLRVDRGMALHKMIRLMTIATAGDGYLNFMGNEFGHPEWIDFPREGNNWSYEHARRLWSLVDDKDLRFRFLNEFDKAMISLAKKDGFFKPIPLPVVRDNERQILVFRRGAYLFVFNFNPQSSFSDYRFEVEAGKYLPVLDTDNQLFSGFNRIDDGLEHFTLYREGRNWLSLYIPSRTAVVLQLQEENLKMKK